LAHKLIFANMEILTLQRAIDNVLSVANKEQNSMYTPSMATMHFNIASSFVLGEIKRLYPESRSIIEFAKPFYKTSIKTVNSSIVTLESNHDYLVGISIAVNEDSTSPCNCKVLESDDPNSPLFTEMQTQKMPCTFINVSILEEDTFNHKTTESFIKPSYNYPIGKYVSGNNIKICPNDITHVELSYLCQPKKYQIGYNLMLDDTWQIDDTLPTHVESEWHINVEPHFFKAMSFLYSMGVKDSELKTANNELKKLGLF
jgi:hypothetical protein